MDPRMLHTLLKDCSSTASSIPQPDVEVFFYYNNLHIIEGLARVAFINPGGSSFTVPAPPPVVPARWDGNNYTAVQDNVNNNDHEEEDDENDSSGADDGEIKELASRMRNAQELDEYELNSPNNNALPERSKRRGGNKNQNWTVYAAVETHHPLPLLFMRPTSDIRKKKPPLAPQPSKAPSTAAATVQFNTTLADIHEPLVRNNSQRLLLNPKKYNVTYVAPVVNDETASNTAFNSNGNIPNATSKMHNNQRRMSLINNTWASSSALPDHPANNNSGFVRNMKPTPIPPPANFSTTLNNSNGLHRQNTLKSVNNYYDLTRQNSSNMPQNSGLQRRTSVKPVEPHSPPRFGPFRAFHIKKHQIASAVGQAANNAAWVNRQPSANGGFGINDDPYHPRRLQYSPSNGGGLNNFVQPLLSVSPLHSGNNGSTAAVYTERGIFGLVEELSLPPAAVDAPPPPRPEPLLRLLEPRPSSGPKQSGSRGSILLLQSRMRGRRMSKPSILNQLIARSEARPANRFNNASSFQVANNTSAYRTTPQVKATVEQPFLIVTMFGSTQSETASKRFENNWFDTTLAHYVLNNIPKTFRLRCVRFLRRKTTFLPAPVFNDDQQNMNSNDMLTNYYAGSSGYYQQQLQLQQQQRMQSIQYICTIEVMPTASSILANAVNLKIDLAKQNECELLREILTAELLNFVIKLRAFYVGIVGVYERVNTSQSTSETKRRGEQEISTQNLTVAANVHNPAIATPSPTRGVFSGKHDFSGLLAERRRSSISSAGSGNWQMLRRRNMRRDEKNVSRGSIDSLGGSLPRESRLHTTQQQDRQQYGGSAMHIDTEYRPQQQYYNTSPQPTMPMYLMRSEQQIHQQPHSSSRMMVHASPTLTAMYVEDERSPFGGSLMQRLAAAKRQEQKAKQLKQEQAQKKRNAPSSVPIGLRRLDSDGAASDDSEKRHRGGAAPWAFPFYGGRWKIRTPQ